MDKPYRPFWLPDTQGFLAIAIVGLIGAVLILLLLHPIALDDKTTGLLQIMLGILLGSFKDVYSFFFGSSKGSEKKDDALISGVVSPTVVPPSGAAKALSFIAVLMTGFLLLGGGDAFAQSRRLTGDLIKDLHQPEQSEAKLPDIIKILDAKLLPDLQYAHAMAMASGSNVTAPCYQAWIDIIQARQKSVTNPDGTEMPAPDPHLVSDFEKAVEIRNALQSDSKFMIACSPVAQMVKKDVISMMGLFISGGAGLAALIPGL